MIEYILIASVVFLFGIVVHEFIHYIVAKRFGRDAKFGLVSSKEKHAFSIFGWLPCVHCEYEGIKELKWISLSPIPFTFLFDFLFLFILFYEYWSVVEWDLRTYYVLFATVVFSLVATLFSCRIDIRDYYSVKNVERS